MATVSQKLPLWPYKPDRSGKPAVSLAPGKDERGLETKCGAIGKKEIVNLLFTKIKHLYFSLLHQKHHTCHFDIRRNI